MLDILSGIVIGLHLASVHVPARDAQHNLNPGIYVRDQATGITAGTYRNTLGRQTFYVGETMNAGPFALTIGVASGYQRRDVPCPAEEARFFYTTCFDRTGGVKTYLTPLLAPSVRLPAVFGVTPRLTFMPGLAGRGNVFHLSVEHAL